MIRKIIKETGDAGAFKERFGCPSERSPGTPIDVKSPSLSKEEIELIHEKIKHKIKRSEDLLKFRQKQKFEYVRIFISFLVLSSALFIVLKDSYSDPAQKWAFGAIGTILGYWLKN